MKKYITALFLALYSLSSFGAARVTDPSLQPYVPDFAVVDTVDDLRNLSGAPQIANAYAKVLSVSPGGTTDFLWVPASTAVDDGVTVIKIRAVTIGRFIYATAAINPPTIPIALGNVSACQTIRTNSYGVNSFIALGVDGGLFIRNPNDTSSTDDGGNYCGTIVRGADFATKGVWNRIYVGALSPHWYGAVGDGITDDTAAIQAAINKGGLIQFQALTYSFSSLAINTNYTTLQGAGIYKTILKPTATAVDAISIATTASVTNNAIKDLQIFGNGTSTAGLVLGSASFPAPKVVIDHVAISFFTAPTSGSGIRIVNSFWINIQNECDLNGNYNNIFIPASGIVTTLEISGNTTISNAVNNGILSSSNVLSNVDKVILRHISFEHNTKEAILSTSPGTVWTLDQTYFEQNSASGTGSLNITSSIAANYNFAVVHVREAIFHTTISGPEMVFGYVQQSTVENCEGVNSLSTSSTSLIKFGYMRGKRPANILSLYAGLSGTIVAEDIDTATGKRVFYNSGSDLLSGHFGPTQITAPTVAPLAGAGTGATVTLATGSTDISGLIQYTPGTGAVAGTNVRLTFNRAYAASPIVIVSYGSNDGATTAQMFTSPQGSPFSYFDLGFVIAPVAGLKFINYWVIGQ